MIKSLQGLRVIAMLLIFFFHCSFINEGNWSIIYNIFFYDGYFAVTFFFILSGLVTYRSLSKNSVDNTFKESIKITLKRMRKMYPLHLIILIILLLLSFKPGNIIKKLLLSIPHFLLVQSFIPIVGVCFSFNGVSWYLSSLTFCYFISNFLYYKLTKIKSENLMKFMIIIYLLQLIVVFMGQNNPMHHWLFYINPVFRSIDFCLGMLLGRILIESKNITFKNINYTSLEIGLVLILILMYTFARYVPQAFRWGVYYTPILILIIAIFSKESGRLSKFLGNKIFMKLSTVSFEFFMIHQLVITHISKYFTTYTGECLIVILLLSLLIAIIIKYLFKHLLSPKKDNVECPKVSEIKRDQLKELI